MGRFCVLLSHIYLLLLVYLTDKMVKSIHMKISIFLLSLGGK